MVIVPRLGKIEEEGEERKGGNRGVRWLDYTVTQWT